MKTKRALLHRACATALAIGAALLTLPQSVSAQASAATLGHRYTFNADTITLTNTDNGDGTFTTNVFSVADVVGGSAWDGTLANGGIFTNVVFTNAVSGSVTTNGELILVSGSQQYVEFPPGILSNYTAITVDMWCTQPQGSSEWGFLWTFGMTWTNPADWYFGTGGNCIFLSPPGRVCISGTMPSWGGEQNANFGTNLGNFFAGSPYHLTCVIDPPHQRLLAYTNGSLAGVNYSETWALTSVSGLSNYIARSLFNADPYVDVWVDEYRIWNGALNGQEVAGCEIAGPDNTTPAPVGTVTNITVQVPITYIVQGAKEQATVSGLATLFPNPVYIDNFLCTYTSTNTGILKVDTNGVITAVGVGTASITASYGSASNSVSITVYPPPLMLGHRYSFNGDLSDLAGGTNWDGTQSGGTLTSSNVILQSATADYVSFPPGMISNYWAVTVDCWATFPASLSGNMFAWTFGRINGGVGANYIFLQPAQGRIAIGGNDPGYSGEESCYGIGDLGNRTNVHVTAVFDPVAGWMAAFVNGQLVGQNTNVTWPMSDIGSTDNFIARSLYSGDLYVDVNMDEYRVFEGTLTPQEIAVADQAGPDALPGAITNGPGSVVGFNVLVTNHLEWLEASPVKVLVNYQYLTNWDIVANSLTPPTNLVVTTSDPNILTITGDGKVLGRNPGTANVIITYQSVTTNMSVTVTRSAPTATLAHRYSFSETSGSTVADSIGGPAWNGTLPNGGTWGGGQLSLSNASSQYVNLPAGIVSNYTAITIEAWATFQSGLPGTCCFFSFGNTVSWYGEYYIFCAPQGGRFNISGATPGYTGEQNAYSGIDWSGKTLHITGVINPPLGYIAIYTNGVLAGVNGSETWSLNTVSNVYSYINKSLYPGDPYSSITIDEFRIYNGALTPDDAALTEKLGADVVLSPKLAAAIAGGNVVLSWPTNYTGFTLQSNGNLKGGSWGAVGTSPVISGWYYQVTEPATNTAQFFRLSK